MCLLSLSAPSQSLISKADEMGGLCCKFSKEVEEDEADPKPKEYSWDKHRKLNPSDFMIDSLDDKDVCRLAGTVNGQQFLIQNCRNSSIFLLDHIDSITIDDCVNCKIVIGPVKGSVFIRDSSKCVIVVPCAQFRLRDCHHLDVFLLCATQPIIEASSFIQFACIRMLYKQIKDHMKVAGLSAYNNLWYNVHDFTPSDGDPNWKKLPLSTRLQDYITPPFPVELRDSGWSISGEYSVIPLSYGMPETSTTELCLVLCCGGFNNQQDECADAFLKALRNENDQCVLLTSRELILHSSDAEAMQLNSDFLNINSTNNPVIGLIVGGSNSFNVCLHLKEKLKSAGNIFISPDPASAARQANSFLQCALMHLG